MKKFLLSILCCMLAVFSVQAEEYTYTFSAKQFTANGTKTLGNFDWTLAGDGGYWGYTETKGQQFGSGALPYKSMTFSTSGISGTITKIVVNTSGASDIAATARVTVGGADFGEVITLTNTATAYTFTGTASGDIVLSYTQTSSKAIYIKSISVTYTTAGGEGPAAPTLPKACNFDDAMTVEITGIADGATAYYSLNDENNWIEGSSVEITETTTVYAKVVKDKVSSTVVSETYTKNTPVTPPAEGEVVDVLNRELTGIAKNAGYSAWTGKTATSSAVYAGMSAGNNDAIQLKSKDSTSGIVTTKSGGKAKKIVVEWNNATSDRTLDVYGKNSAYSEATDLYSASTQGTKLGSIVCGTSTELVIDGDYEYIGLRSNNGAMYLTSVSITWDASNVVVIPDAPEIPATSDFVTSMNFEIANVDAYEDGTTVYYSIGDDDFKEYTKPFPITTTSEIVAYAEKDEKKSAEVRAKYTRIANDPVINVLGDADADAFEGSIEVEIETENDATAYYTLNGEEPTVESTKYEGALTIKATATLKVIAVEEGEYRSKNVVDKTFTMALNDTSVDVDANSATFDASVQNYDNGVAIESVTIVEGITATFGKGSNKNNSPKYYSTGSAIRCYGGNNFTIESTAGTITKIVLTFSSGEDNNNITTDCGGFSNDTWVGNAESVKFTIDGSSGHRRIQTITVTYGEPKNEDYSLVVTSAGWATLFLDYAVAIPADVTCYAVSAVDGEYATLAEVEGVIPANTGVIVEAHQGNYTFKVATEEDSDVANELIGTTVNTYITKEAYVLGIVDGVVGLYKAQMAGGVWLNNANKAYLVVPGASEVASYSFRFGEGTTGVEKIEIRNEKSEIYDLTGRKIENVAAPGIYVVNGKKVLVK